MFDSYNINNACRRYVTSFFLAGNSFRSNIAERITLVTRQIIDVLIWYALGEPTSLVFMLSYARLRYARLNYARLS